MVNCLDTPLPPQHIHFDIGRWISAASNSNIVHSLVDRPSLTSIDQLIDRSPRETSPLPAMDIVLEIFDGLVFDRMYAILAPVSSSSYLSIVQNATTSTFSSMREGATVTPEHQYIYRPASQLISLEPSVWAYRSSFPRDNICRQAFSLFLITWSANRRP